jgi:WD40 repeat protein
MSTDGRHAAITGQTGQVELLDVRSGRPVRPAVQAHDAGAYWAAFSPDGTRLVTNAQDGSVLLWDTRTAEVLARVSMSRNGGQTGSAPSAAAFRADGRTLLIAPEFGHAVFVWDPSKERALDFACRMAGRDLTQAEWADNFPDQPFQETCPPQSAHPANPPR